MRRGSRIKNVAGAALGVGAVLYGSVSRAAPSARLVYIRDLGTEMCPDERAIRAAVAARLGYDPFFLTAPTTMFAEVSKESRGFLVRMKLVNADNLVLGSREIKHEGESCSDVIDTMALSMSIAIDPDSLLRAKGGAGDGPMDGAADPPDAASSPIEGSLQRPAAAADAPAAPSMAPAPSKGQAKPDSSALNEGQGGQQTRPPSAADGSRSSPWHLDVGVGASLWVAAAPSPNVAGNVFLRARRGWASVSLEGRDDAPASVTRSSGASFQTALALADVAACGHGSAWSLCAVAAAGSLAGETKRGVTTPRSDHAFQAGLGPRAAFETRLAGGFSLWARVDALVSLTPHTLQVNGSNVFTLSPLAVGAGFGVAYRFF